MSRDSSVVVRPARLEDAGAIARVHVRSWQQTYKGQVPDDYLESLDKDIERREKLMVKLFNESPQNKMLVADADGKVVGFCYVGPSAEDSSRGELASIYLLNEYWGQGVGYRLHEEGLEVLRQMGFQHAGLWVLDTNHRTRRWYERQGWRATDERKIDDRGSFQLNEVRYTRDL